MQTLAQSFESAGQDVMHGCRVLWNRPAILIGAVSVLGLTIGASMALLSLLDRFLIKPLPVDRSERLVQLLRPAGKAGPPQESFPPTLISKMEGSSAHVGTILTVGYASDEFYSYSKEAFAPEPVRSQSVDTRTFGLLGVHVTIGRGFVSDDREPGAEQVAVLSHAYWQRRFRGSPDVLDKRFRRRDKLVRIVGVMPREFSELDLGSSPDVWLPVSKGQGGRVLVVLREANGAHQLESALRPAFEEHLKQEPPNLSRQGNSRYLDKALATVDASKGMRSALQNRFKTSVITAALATIVLLLTGCVNVGLLLLAFHAQRSREMAVRVALGASRGRLVRQVVAETSILSAAACVIGAVLAPIATRVLVTLVSDPDRPIRIEWQWDWRFVAIALALCTFTTAFSAAVPAYRLFWHNSAHSIRGQMAFGSSRLGGFRSNAFLISVQAGLAVVLLVGGGLLQSSWRNLDQLNPGFNKDRLVVAELQWEREGSRSYSNSVYRLLLDRIAERPGVAAVSLSGWSCFGGSSRRASIVAEDPPGDGRSAELCEFLSVAPRFFKTMGVPIVRGRDFASSDTEATRLVAILNESANRLYFGNTDELGRRFSIFDPAQKIEIVGVVADTKLNSLRESTPPTVYLPFFQSEFRGTSDMPASIEIQTSPGIRIDSFELNRMIQASTPGLAVRRVRTQRELVQRSLLPELLLSVVSVTLGLVALALATLGLGGSIAYSVAGRQKEFGIRLALGATARKLVADGVTRALAPVGMGIVGGACVAFVLARYLTTMLFGVEPSDPFVLAGAGLLLLTASACAAVVPLIGTARIDPAAALRQD
jgi:putative ABC transport system permease protein